MTKSVISLEGGCCLHVLACSGSWDSYGVKTSPVVCTLGPAPSVLGLGEHIWFLLPMIPSEKALSPPGSWVVLPSVAPGHAPRLSECRGEAQTSQQCSPALRRPALSRLGPPGMVPT